jgi:hypothetical protein
LLAQLDESLQKAFPCDRCRCRCATSCEAAPACDSRPAGDSRPTCGCAEKSGTVPPPAPPAPASLLNDNPFRDDAPAPNQPKPAPRLLPKLQARTASVRVAHVPAVDASSATRGEPRPLPRLLDAAPLRTDQPVEPAVLRTSDRTASTPAARPAVVASPAVHFVPLPPSPVIFYATDHEPIVRPVQADTADALGVANRR